MMAYVPTIKVIKDNKVATINEYRESDFIEMGWKRLDNEEVLEDDGFPNADEDLEQKFKNLVDKEPDPKEEDNKKDDIAEVKEKSKNKKATQKFDIDAVRALSNK